MDHVTQTILFSIPPWSLVYLAFLPLFNQLSNHINHQRDSISTRTPHSEWDSHIARTRFASSLGITLPPQPRFVLTDSQTAWKSRRCLLSLDVIKQSLLHVDLDLRLLVEESKPLRGLSPTGPLQGERGEMATYYGPRHEVDPGETTGALGVVKIRQRAI